jgi:hypothetical protein
MRPTFERAIITVEASGLTAFAQNDPAMAELLSRVLAKAGRRRRSRYQRDLVK